MSERIPLIVHVNDEAGVTGEDDGGVRAVLAGLVRTAVYQEAVERTLLAGPFPTNDAEAVDRLTDPASGVRIAYSSRHGIYQGVEESRRAALHAIEQHFGVALLYGTRNLDSCTCELLLVDAAHPNRQEADHFKLLCWERFGLDSLRHSANAEYNLSMALARPLLAAIEAIGGDGGFRPTPPVLLAHNWAAIPLALAAQMGRPGQWHTVFYAHETPTARRLVEEMSGHDTAFYNTLAKAKEWNLSLESIYGSQEQDHRHALLRLATRCDAIFTAGDTVADELRFLGGRFANARIEPVYHGCSTASPSPAEKNESKARLQQYAEKLLGYRPDYVFTHIAPMVLAQAFWRDLRLLGHLEETLRKTGQSAVLFVLANSLPAGRRPQWVYAWEEQYGWPVNHRDDNGDLVGLESIYYNAALLPFNGRSKAVRGVLVNQVGWSRDRCGVQMPSAMTPADIRRGSDMEFGQSIYEPFGASQVEALANGSLCCLSSMCGCIGLAARAAGDLARLPNLVIADYVSLPRGYWVGSPYDALKIDMGIRDWIEGDSSERAAQSVAARLPQTDEQRRSLLESGSEVAKAMSWEAVVSGYLLPALRRVRGE